MKNRNGCHFPNSMFREMGKFNAIPWACFTVLSNQRADVPALRAQFPDAQIHMRGYLPNWYETDAGEWALQIKEWADELRQFGIIDWTFANEQNLRIEGHPLAAGSGNPDYPPRSVYVDIAEWNMAVRLNLRALIPWARLWYPALSQGHSDDQNDAGYVGFEILRPGIELCDGIHVHTYWQPGIKEYSDPYFGRRYEKVHSLFPAKPLFISECGMRPWNAADVAPWLNGLPDYVEGATWFIWDTDVNNAGWELYNQPAMVDAFRGYVPEAIVPSPAAISPFRGGYRITQLFGENPQDYARFGLVAHNGVDMTPRNTDRTIHAVEAGKVVRVDEAHPTLGKFVVVWNSATRRGWWYAHLASIAVKLGDTVGQIIGVMGSTGNSTGPHLHLGLRLTDQNGIAINKGNGYNGFIDPLPILKGEAMGAEDFELNPIHLRFDPVNPPCYRGEVRYFDANKGQGNESANIYIRAYHKDGSPAYGLRVRQSWTGGIAEKTLTTVTSNEIPGDPKDGTPFAGCDFFMSKDSRRPTHDSPGAYTIELLGVNGQRISGFGLNENWAHDAYRVEFREIEAESQTFGAALGAFLKSKEMAVNDKAALFKYAKTHGLGDAQTDELRFVWGGTEYIVQSFNYGRVYITLDDWASGWWDKIKHIAK